MSIHNDIQKHLDYRVRQEKDHIFVMGVKLLHENKTPSWTSCCHFYHILQSPESCCNIKFLKQLYRHQHIDFIHKYFFVYPNLTALHRKQQELLSKRIEECIHHLYVQGDIAGFDRKTFAAFIDIVERWAIWVKRNNIRSVNQTNLASYRNMIHLYYSVYGTAHSCFVLDVLEDLYACVSRQRKMCF